ncbi:Mss4-like protein [Trichoderma pleuroticola]
MESNPMIRCQCEAISFRAVLPKPLAVDVCHCLECQRQSSSAFGVSAVFPVEGMLPFPESIRPHVGMWTRKTDSGCTLECYFCKTCGVRVIHRGLLPDGTSRSTLTVKGGCMENLNLKDARHIYTRSARIPVPEGSWPGPPDEY